MKRLIFILAACVSTIATLQAQPQPVRIQNSNYLDYLEKISNWGGNGNRYTIRKTDITTENLNKLKAAKTLVLASDLPLDVRDFYYNHPNIGGESNVLANLEEIVLEEGHPIMLLDVRGTLIERATIQNPRSTRTFEQLNIQSSRLKPENITLGTGSNIALKEIHLHRSRVTSMELLYGWMKEGVFEALYLNSGRYNRYTRSAKINHDVYNPTNQIREIDMDRIPSNIRALQLTWNLLDHIDGFDSRFNNITNMMLNNNLMWSLDLSHISVDPSAANNYDFSPQKPMADLWVEKGVPDDGSGDELRLYIPAARSAAFDNSRLIGGSVKFMNGILPDQTTFEDAKGKYFKLKQVTRDGINADLDYYGVHDGFTYKYNTRPLLTDPEKRDMEVQVKVYPYIMYVNPVSKSGRGVGYYSGTLWLDYHSIVPEGTTVWIATGIRPAVTTDHTEAHNQLVLEKIGDPGDVIPAGTAMYVRSDSKAGLYAFQKAWTPKYVGWDGPFDKETQDALATDTVMYNEDLTLVQEKLDQQIALIGNRNILEGSGEAKYVGARKALTLGVENQKGTKMIGFWPYTGTTLAAHRCYITEAKYEELMAGSTPSSGAAKGVSFFFEEPTEVTGIESIDNGQRTIADDAWYSIDGKRLNGKPAQKGLYIHNGRKEAVL